MPSVISKTSSHSDPLRLKRTNTGDDIEMKMSDKYKLLIRAQSAEFKKQKKFV